MGAVRKKFNQPVARSKRLPAAIGMPRRKSAAGMRRAPGFWSSVTHRAPSPQATITPAPSASSTSPGRAGGVDGAGAPQLDRRAVQRGEGAGEGVEGAHGPFDLDGRAGPVDRGLGLADLGGVGDALGRLGRGLELAGGQGLEGFDDELGAHPGQAVVEAAGGVVGLDGFDALEEHRAGVEPGVHLHDGDAGFRVAGFDGAVDRRRAAPAGAAARRGC